MSKLTLCFVLLVAAAHAAPVHLRTDALNTPIGLDTPQPTFSWMSDATIPNWIQSAYEILVDTDERNLRVGKASSWDSGRVASSESVDILYAGAPLKAQQRYAWKVITWGRKGEKSVSVPTWFETGLLSASDWQAQWITRKDPLAEENSARFAGSGSKGRTLFTLRPPLPLTSAMSFNLMARLQRGACMCLLAERSLRASMAR